jgi:hypothetical protein
MASRSFVGAVADGGGIAMNADDNPDLLPLDTSPREITLFWSRGWQEPHGTTLAGVVGD